MVIYREYIEEFLKYKDIILKDKGVLGQYREMVEKY